MAIGEEKRAVYSYSELVSFHEAASMFASTHDLERLLDLTMDQCLRAARAETGSIQICDQENNELVIVRGRGIRYEKDRSPLDDSNEWEISKRVLKSGKPMMISGSAGTVVDGMRLTRDDVGHALSIPIVDHIAKDDGSAMSVPLKTTNEIVGIVNLNRGKGSAPFSETDLEAVCLLASQAGVAINNAHLYKSLNHRLAELTLICNFSESLMGLVDPIQVIKCLFDTVRKDFPIDFIGSLLAQKRGHDFLYWSRGYIDDGCVKEVCERLTAEHNRLHGLNVNHKKARRRYLALGTDGADHTETPAPDACKYAFEHILPISWENIKFGSIIFCARKPLSDEREKMTILSGLVNQTRIALINTRFYNEMKENYIRTIKALAIAVDAKDKYTYGHSENVQLYSEEIASEMGMDEKQIGIIRDAGLLHDIGKIGIPGYILNKPGPLTDEEFNGIMKNHSVLGANILKDVPFLHDLHKLVLHHHEHYDGAGYPQGLSGDDIPIGARIIHLADAFEAMTADRPYRTSLGTEEAINRITDECGKQFDPKVVEAFMEVARRKGWAQG